jgi:hypothetical protein
MSVQTAVSRHLYSVLYHKRVSHVIMLTEEETFVFRTWYKSGFQAIHSQWRDHYDSVPPARKATYHLHQQSEHDTVFSFPRTGRSRTARSEENTV